jgi:hypothetical protein
MLDVLKILLASDDPSIRYKALVGVAGENPESAKAKKARALIGNSARVKGLLSFCDKSGRVNLNPYSKWDGAHWVLVSLADLCYPPGDKTLQPLRDRVYDWLLSEHHAKHIRVIKGLTRRCASQEGNALYTSLFLGIADDRADELAARLCRWQWPDGGWNCDKKPDVIISSYRETIVPMRALNLHARLTGSEESRRAVERVADLFLKRRLFRRLKDGSVMRPSFVELHYPRYYEYDILFALVVLAEAGFITDPRCTEALDLLESKRLSDGGFPCEKKLYRYLPEKKAGRVSRIDWGGAKKNTMNEFVTADALYVLRLAGRLK